MVCKCRDGTYGPECCSRGRGGAPKSSATRPQPMYYGTTPGKVLTKGGDVIQNLGTVKQVAALTASHPIEGKIWTQYSRKELVAQKRKTGNTQISEPVKKYDARPERWTGAQKRHWERRPMTGKYSKAKSGNTALYRAKKYATASGIKYSGTAIKGLGYMYYGYVAYHAYKDPKQIPKLLLAGIPQISTMGMEGVTYDPKTQSFGDIKSQHPPNPFQLIFD
jgi:hypothetical protein